MNGKFSITMASPFIGHPDMRRLYLRNDWVGSSDAQRQ